MREIKFRVWDKEKKEIYYFESLDDIYEEGYKGGMSKSFSELEVMQYIGLKDKNGKEIYEGDILFQKGEEIGFYYRPDLKFIIKPIDEVVEQSSYFGEDCSSFYEVIGNIYENSELSNES